MSDLKRLADLAPFDELSEDIDVADDNANKETGVDE
jgi:hypothetical protein